MQETEEMWVQSLGLDHPLEKEIAIVAQLVKNPPVMWETWVQSLGWEDPRRREQPPTPVFWPGESLQSMGLQRVGHN